MPGGGACRTAGARVICPPNPLGGAAQTPCVWRGPRPPTASSTRNRGCSPPDELPPRGQPRGGTALPRGRAGLDPLVWAGLSRPDRSILGSRPRRWATPRAERVSLPADSGGSHLAGSGGRDETKNFADAAVGASPWQTRPQTSARGGEITRGYDSATGLGPGHHAS